MFCCEPRAFEAAHIVVTGMGKELWTGFHRRGARYRRRCFAAAWPLLSFISWLVPLSSGVLFRFVSVALPRDTPWATSATRSLEAPSSIHPVGGRETLFIRNVLRSCRRENNSRRRMSAFSERNPSPFLSFCVIILSYLLYFFLASSPREFSTPFVCFPGFWHKTRTAW